MANSVIYEAKLTNYVPVIWYGQAVYSYYARLKNHLIQHLGEEYAMLFAEPHVSANELKGVGKANWTSALFSEKPQVLTSLSEAEQIKYRTYLKTSLEKLDQYAQSLLESENAENNKWGQLINRAIKIPNLDHVMVAEGKAVLVVWGFEMGGDHVFYDLKKDLPRLATPPFGNTDTSTLPIQEEPKVEIKEENKVETDIITEEPQLPVTTPILPENEIQNQEEPELAVPNKVEELAKINLTEREVNTEIPPKVEQKRYEEDEKQKEKVVPPKEKPKKKWWEKFWWIWLIILVFMITFIIWIFSSSGNSGTIAVGILPENPNIVVPVDSANIVKDPENVRQIVANRLNIALTGTNKNISEFAVEFKKQYSADEYKIIYYDTVTHRLQIEVPQTEREKIRDEIKTKMPSFEMLIWNEGMLRQNYIPSDPDFANSSNSWYHKMVKAPEAWEITQGDNEVIIAIIDDSFDGNHPEFKGKIYKPWNVTSYSPKITTAKGKGIHGTHVAGIATALAENGQGVTGIAPKCKLMPIQVGDENGLMSMTAIIDGVLYAIDNGADVVNMSLGMQVYPEIVRLNAADQQKIADILYKEEEEFWNQLFKIAYDRNVIIVLAGGNQDVIIGLDPMQRTPYTINVSATDPTNTKASFSNYGNKSTISAPGVQIYNSLPNGKYGNLDGTSMAAPVVTGGIALIKSANPSLSFDQIKDLIQSTGLPLGAGFSKEIGNLLQLDKALNVAYQNRQQQPIVECPDMQSRIDSLLQEIAKIKERCDSEETANGRDTLKIPDSPKDENDFSFALGRWKSTTYIYNQAGEKVTIYFDFFANGTGKISVVEPNNTECTASLDLALLANQFNINQKSQAICNPPPSAYNPYTFECKPDANGNAECWAQNKSDKSNAFKFRLIKIKSI
jgi:subtilisin family serine protease